MFKKIKNILAIIITVVTILIAFIFGRNFVYEKNIPLIISGSAILSLTMILFKNFYSRNQAGGIPIWNSLSFEIMGWIVLLTVFINTIFFLIIF